jgi:hypothetical protein
MRKRIAALLLLAVGTICEAQQQPVQTTQSAPATVFFYRHGGVIGSQLEFPITVDGAFQGAIHNGVYLKISLNPGEHTITSTATGNGPHRDSTFSLHVKPGGEYYLLMGVKGFGFVPESSDLKLVTAEEGRKDVAKLKPPKMKALN